MTRLPDTFVRATLALLCAAGGAAGAQALPPIHALGPVEHKSTELLGAVSAVRALPGGRVLVNDNSGRKVVLFEPSLATFSVVADTTSATANAYSSRAGGLFAYKGDSSLFVDPTSLSMLVIDGVGKIARVMSVPRPNDAGSLIGGQSGTPGFDAQGRLVYRAAPNFGMPKRAAEGTFGMPVFPDSVLLVRIDLATRKLDTIGTVKTQKMNMSMTQDANGRMTVTSIQNPMQVVDDWAVLADGSVAIVRGQDYHIDWLAPDGTQWSSPKVPFAWLHMNDSMKVAFLDSTKTAFQKLRDAAMARAAAGGGANMPLIAPPGDGGGGGGAMIVMRMDAKAGAEMGARPSGPAGAPAAPVIPPMQFVSPSELPDYAPPFNAGSARGDMDGNLWVRTTNTVGGGSVYDVISKKGELMDRVQVPAGRVIAGFGVGGVVYMGVRDTDGVRLEQARRMVASLGASR